MSRPTGTFARLLLALSVTLGLAGPTYAPIRTVCSSGCDYASIQDAVNGAYSGDVLELAAETFVENVSIIEKDLRIQGAGPGATVIDGNASGPVFLLDLFGVRMSTCCGPRNCFPCPVRVFYMATLGGLTIRNGSGTTGGGIEQISGRLHLDNCVIEDNSADSGGGIGAHGAEIGGGAETLDIENCVIRDNDAGSGGGISFAGLEASITTTTISGNSGNPSAIAATYYSPVDLTRSTISGNIGSSALESSSRVTISTTTISGNQGVALQARNLAGVRITESTIAGSQIGISGMYRVWMSRSVLAGNTLADCVGVEYFYSSGHNLIEGPCEFNDGEVLATDIRGADALLLPLDDNGGPTLTHALAPGSPAIDAGGDLCGPTDQRGALRPRDGDGDGVATCDIGAFEFFSALARVDELIDQVRSLDLHHGIENGLLAKLDAASLILGDLQPDNDHAAANVLGAFMRHVRAQSGKKIAAADGDALIDAAEAIVELLSQGVRIRREEFRQRLFSTGKRLVSDPLEPE